MSLADSTFRICQYAAFVGLTSHWAYFRQGEHHLEAPLLTLLFFIALPILFLAEFVAGNDGILFAGLRASAIYFSFLLPLWTSMVVYRVFFHRLRKFPGPVMNKVTKFWHMSRVAAKSNNYLYLDALHREYGDFVRTGPTEICVYHPDGVQALLGPGSQCKKAAWYDIAIPLLSLQTDRNRGSHDKRRKIWDKGFGAKALRGYEDRVSGFSKTLVRRIADRAGQVISLTTEFQYFAFDIMGDVAFGKSFGMMESGTSHFALKIIKDGMAPLGIFTPVPWALHVLTKVPGAAKDLLALISWCADQIESRRKMQAEMHIPDVMTYLIDEFEKSSKADTDRLLLNGDSRLIVVAGSDTTSATLTTLFYELAKNPNEMHKLRTELDPIVESNVTTNHKALQEAPHLNAVINETLRLYPPVPGGLFRLTPPEGITIAGTYIPGNVTVIAPTYTVQRLASCYERPEEFIPERWYSKPELARNKSTFSPFGGGPYSCVGKQLALMELRTVVSMLVTGFDVQLAPGEDGTALIHDLKDCFTVEQRDLKVIFTPREKVV